VRKVPVTITDTAIGGDIYTLHVDTTAEPIIVVDVEGFDVVGIDLNAGTVGTWEGEEPNREWTVVYQFPGYPAAGPDDSRTGTDAASITPYTDPSAT
jgi:hypothetical protein